MKNLKMQAVSYLRCHKKSGVLINHFYTF